MSIKIQGDTARCEWVFVIAELFKITFSDFDTVKSALYMRVFLVAEFVVFFVNRMNKLYNKRCRFKGIPHNIRGD